jgi:hypothetical protein
MNGDSGKVLMFNNASNFYRDVRRRNRQKERVRIPYVER